MTNEVSAGIPCSTIVIANAVKQSHIKTNKTFLNNFSNVSKKEKINQRGYNNNDFVDNSFWIC